MHCAERRRYGGSMAATYMGEGFAERGEGLRPHPRATASARKQAGCYYSRLSGRESRPTNGGRSQLSCRIAPRKDRESERSERMAGLPIGPVYAWYARVHGDRREGQCTGGQRDTQNGCLQDAELRCQLVAGIRRARLGGRATPVSRPAYRFWGSFADWRAGGPARLRQVRGRPARPGARWLSPRSLIQHHQSKVPAGRASRGNALKQKA